MLGRLSLVGQVGPAGEPFGLAVRQGKGAARRGEAEEEHQLLEEACHPPKDRECRYSGKSPIFWTN